MKRLTNKRLEEIKAQAQYNRNARYPEDLFRMSHEVFELLEEIEALKGEVKRWKKGFNSVTRALQREKEKK